jgi:hypothetical protein
MGRGVLLVVNTGVQKNKAGNHCDIMLMSLAEYEDRIEAPSSQC